MHRYRVAGLALDSDIVLTGLAGRDGGDADMFVRVADAAAIAQQPAEIGPGWSATPDTVTLDIPGIARLQAIGGNALYVVARGDQADAAAFIVGTGLGILLQQRGCTMLRGTAVERNGSAVLFTGPVGVGTSTLAMKLGTLGYAVIADDLCRLTFDGVAHVVPSETTCRLSRPAIDRLGITALAPVRPGIGHYHVVPPASADMPRPLREVFILRTGDDAHPPGMAPMTSLEATVALYAAAYRPALVTPLGQERAQFRAAALIRKQAMVRTLTVPRGLGHLDETAAQLEEHWAAV